MSDLIENLRGLGTYKHDDVSVALDAIEEIERQSNNAAILAQQVADLTAERDALRASFAAIHARVCHAPVTDGMCAAIADECEHAVPELAPLRGNP